MQLSVLIPFRDADGTRTRAHQWMLARWRHFWPDAEFIVEPDDGVDPFNKSMAVNRAAARATGDVYAILDADTWIDPMWVTASLDAIAAGAPWVVPARKSIRLRQDASERIMAGLLDAPLPISHSELRSLAEQVGWVVGFLWFVPRAGWEKLGGMDERVRGWGGEDTMFTKAANVLLGVHHRLPGTVVCLWHDRPRQNKRRVWVGQDRTTEHAKNALAGRYTTASNPRKMVALLSEQGGPLWAG